MDKYKDIINLPHKQSNKRPHMPLLDRAAQFAPFAALTGYDDAVKETARLTDRQIEIGEDTKIALNERLRIAMEQIENHPVITVTYFMADSRKNGGAYVKHTGVIKKIDECERKVIFRDQMVIPIDCIYEMDGEIYKHLC